MASPSRTRTRSPSPSDLPQHPPDISPMKRRRGIPEPSSEEAGIELEEEERIRLLQSKEFWDKLSSENSDDGLPYYYRGGTTELDIEMRLRRDRQSVREQFRANYTYTSAEVYLHVFVTRKRKELASGLVMLILGEAEKTSSGIMWVAVHGKDSICVVTRDEKMDLTRVSGFLKCTSEIEIRQHFRQIVVYEIEGLADPSNGLRQSIGLDQSIEKPFSVVSVIEGYNKVNEKNGHEGSIFNYDGKKACEYLEEKMKSGVDFSIDETIKTAISGFHLLFCRRKFKAKEIRVCVFRENRGPHGPHDLHITEVKEYLSVINS